MEFDSYDFDLTRISRFIGVEKCFMSEIQIKMLSSYSNFSCNNNTFLISSCYFLRLNLQNLPNRFLRERI